MKSNNFLLGISATNIKSIEIITDPPAKYEAQGGAVINIITSRNIPFGYSRSIYSDYKMGSEYPKYSFGTNHFFRTEKINAYINYNISPRKDFRHIADFINFIDDNKRGYFLLVVENRY